MSAFVVPFRLSLLQRLRSWFGSRPETLFGLMRKRPRHSSTSRLYVLEVNFEIRPDTDAARSLAEQREYLLEKYGVDLFVVEPGFKLKRWDDF